MEMQHSPQELEIKHQVLYYPGVKGCDYEPKYFRQGAEAHIYVAWDLEDEGFDVQSTSIKECEHYVDVVYTGLVGDSSYYELKRTYYYKK